MEIATLYDELKVCLDDIKAKSSDDPIRKTTWARHLGIVTRLLEKPQWATIHYSGDHPDVQTPIAEADVLYLTASEARILLTGDYLDKPIVIRDSDCDEARDSFRGLSLLCATGEEELDIQNYERVEWANEEEERRFRALGVSDEPVIRIPARDAIARIEGPERAVTNERMLVNCLNIRGRLGSSLPQKFLMNPFTIIKELDNDLNAQAIQSGQQKPVPDSYYYNRIHLGKEETTASGRPIDVASCISFSIAAERGCFSDPHVDSLFGTAISCESGKKLWVIIPGPLSQEEEQLFSEFDPQNEEHLEWLYRRARIILLEPGDSIIMPPGVKIIHLPITLFNCVMSGIMFWSERPERILDTIALLIERIKNPNVSNEEIQQQLPLIIGRLLKKVSKDDVAARKDPGHQRRFARETRWSYRPSDRGLEKFYRDKPLIFKVEFKRLLRILKKAWTASMSHG